MSKLTTIQTTFASGEVDPALGGQENLKAYNEGARQIRNGIRRATGGVGRRPGFDDLVPIGDVRLVRFEFSNEQRYLLGFGDQSLIILDRDGATLQTITGCPWLADEVDDLTFSHAGDVMVITNCAPTKLLRRTGAMTFELVDFTFDEAPGGLKIYQPYYKFAPPEVTLTVNGSIGSCLVVASSTEGWGGFTQDHVGQRIRIYGAEIEIHTVTDSLNAAANIKGKLEGRLDPDPFKVTRGSTIVEVTHAFHGLTTGTLMNFNGSTDVGKIPAFKFDVGNKAITVKDEHHYTFDLAPLSYEVREDANFDGVNETTTYTSAHSTEDGGGVNVTYHLANIPTRAWLEPAINKIRGYPSASCFHEGRLWLAGTPSQPDARFGSKALFPFNFDVGQGFDGDSVQVAGETEDMSRIRHMLSNGDLQVFTSLRESVFVQANGQPITPSTARSKSQSNAGIGSLPPMIFDGAALFVQENGLSVSELAYSERSAAYMAVPISTLAGHLIRKPRSAAVSQGTSSRAEQFAYFVNEDGTIAVFHSLRSENIAGWGLWDLGGGEARSICALGQDIFVVIKKPWPFTGHRLWRMAEGGIYSLDGQQRHAVSAETMEWELNADCRNRSLHIVSEKGYHGVYFINNEGEITLPEPVKEVIAGSPFYLKIETLPPSISTPEGPQSGKVQRITSVIVNALNAYGLRVAGRRLDSHDPGDLTGPLKPVNGRQQVTVLGYQRDPTVVIDQHAPLPVEAVLSVVTEVKV